LHILHTYLKINKYIHRCVQYVGFAITPIIGAILAAIGHHNRSFLFNINEFTLPATFLGLLAIGNATITYYLFEKNPTRLFLDKGIMHKFINIFI
jgi:hypothetical protein